MWMRRALEEARKGIGRTAPNPAVGCVIVRDETELGAGWHHGAGKPHAEREAIADVRRRHGDEALRGATAYVTLEPCSTHGRTPPCTAGLIEAGIGRVVFAIQDPNPAHIGHAVEILQSAGIEVRAEVLQNEAEEILRPFTKVQQTGLPWVILKTAMSLDGRITRPPGEGMWLTGPEARMEVQRIRSRVEAIITSGETVRRDLPQLDLRVPELLADREIPWRIIMTRHAASLPETAPLFTDANQQRTKIFENETPRKALEKLVQEYGCLSVLIECGGELAAEFIRKDLVDEWIGFLAPRLCGGPTPALGGTEMPGSTWTTQELVQIGPDVMIRSIRAR
jgi:diaminohydroxyphosphoribosylaminopyrimidine deaminase / 5-amino-6-(5-phosphoribosylamino)uracil reductase